MLIFACFLPYLLLAHNICLMLLYMLSWHSISPCISRVIPCLPLPLQQASCHLIELQWIFCIPLCGRKLHHLLQTPNSNLQFNSPKSLALIGDTIIHTPPLWYDTTESSRLISPHLPLITHFSHQIELQLLDLLQHTEYVLYCTRWRMSIGSFLFQNSLQIVHLNCHSTKAIEIVIEKLCKITQLYSDTRGTQEMYIT